MQALLRTDAAHFHAARETLRDEIAHFAEPDAFTDEELQNARNELEVSALYESERPSQHVHTLGYWWAVADLEYYRTYVEQVRRVTREDVQAFARRYLVGRPAVTGILLAPEVRATLLEGV